MKLAELAVLPKLVPVSLDDEDTLEQYNEPLEFYVWDRQPIEKFMQFAGKTVGPEQMPELVAFACELILDEQGNRIMDEGRLLPTSVMTKCITKVMTELGK